MVDLEQDSPSIVLDADEASFLGHGIKLQDLPAGGEEVPSILKQMVADKVTAQKTLKDFYSILESLVDV